MKILRIFMALILLSSIKLFSQSSFESFLNDPFDQTISAIKEKLGEKKYEEKEVKGLPTLSYYDWFDPFSISIQYLFNKNGTLVTKIITNGKENENDADKIFALLKEMIIKKHGPNYTDNSILSVKMFMWKSADNLSIMLVRKGDNTTMMIMKL